jgi:hypothetical protein
MTRGHVARWIAGPPGQPVRRRAFTPFTARPDPAGCRCHLCGRQVPLEAVLRLGDTCEACYPLCTPGVRGPALPLRGGADWYLETRAREAEEERPGATGS